MFAQRRRQWANNSPILGQSLIACMERAHRHKTDVTINERRQVKQYISHLYRGGDIINIVKMSSSDNKKNQNKIINMRKLDNYFLRYAPETKNRWL